MKIDSAYKPSSSSLPSKLGNSAAPSSGEKSSESVSFSGLAGTLLTSGDDSAVDTAKIEEIKAAISEGRFSINAESIADSVIESARDLLNRNSARQA